MLGSQFNHKRWVAEVTPTYRLESVPNRCVTERFDDFVLFFDLHEFSVDIGTFVIRLRQIIFS